MIPTPPVTAPEGTGMAEAPELLLRQVLIEGIVELAGDRERLRELFRRPDSLRQGTQDEWILEAMEVVDRLAKPGETGCSVGVGYPPDHIALPYCSIVLDSAAEQPADATMANNMGRAYQHIGTGSSARSIRHTFQVLPYTSNLQVGCWCVSPEQSSILLTIVRHLLFRHRGQLMGAGVLDLSTSESGFAPDPSLYPRTGFVPIIKLSLDWSLQQTRRVGPVPTTARIRNTRFQN